MRTDACRHIRLLLAVAVATMASSSVADARHWRYHWHYHHGFYQAADEGQSQENTLRTGRNHRSRDEDRGQENTLRPVSNHQSRIEVDSFGRGIEQMISACAGQVVELKRIPFDLVSRTVQANDKQRSALERVRSTANDAAETLSAACPKNTPAGLGQRFDQLGRALDAIATSLATLRPALAGFYDALDDEQKARLVAIDLSRNSLPKSDRGERETANGRARKGSDPAQDPVCRQWVEILRSWPVRQVESGISLSDQQRAILYELTAAIYRATSGLVGACPAEDRFTALGRLDAKQRQLQALRHGIDAIQPFLSKFEDSLNDSQRTQLAMTVTG
jgi:hypothetical protein